jgi:hypothetical protein
MPSTAFDLDALTNRVMGISTPMRLRRRRRPSRGDRILALAMVGSTAVATSVSLGMAAQGHIDLALQVFAGCFLANFVIVNLR